MNPLLELEQFGQSYWLDDLNRPMIASGALARRVSHGGLRGITSNPVIFDKAITSSTAYDDQITRLVGQGASVIDVYEALVTQDVRDACDILRPIYERTDGIDGYVSLEVSPHLAHDAAGSIAEAKRLHAAVDRPNVLMKIPGTTAGLTAIEELLFDGIPVNVTLLFSRERYAAVADAYLRALERRAAARRSVQEPASVASFFLSRIDVLVDQLLSHRASPTMPSRDDANDLRGRIAVANAKLAYRDFERMVAIERWQALAAQGARVQRLLWASTSTKNPSYPDVMYVEPLIGRWTVSTMPEKTAAAFEDHGCVAATLEQGTAESEEILRRLEVLGIDFGLVTEQLLNEGIEKFIKPYDALLESLGAHIGRERGPALRQAPDRSH